MNGQKKVKYIEDTRLRNNILSFPPKMEIFFLKKILLIFRAKGREGKREGETSMCGCLLYPPTGDLACNPDTCPDWESSWWPFPSQASAQSTEPHQLRHILLFFITKVTFLRKNETVQKYRKWNTPYQIIPSFRTNSWFFHVQFFVS